MAFTCIAFCLFLRGNFFVNITYPSLLFFFFLKLHYLIHAFTKALALTTSVPQRFPSQLVTYKFL